MPNQEHPTTKVYPPPLESPEFEVREGEINTHYGYASQGEQQSDVSLDLDQSYTALLQRLEEYASLTENWDGYGAMVPTTDAIEAGKQFIKQLAGRGQHIDFTAPGPNGEISVELKKDSKYIEFVFYPADVRRYTAFDGGKLAERGNYNSDKLTGLLLWLNN